MVSLKSFTTSAVVLGVSLTLAGCSGSSSPTPENSASAPVTSAAPVVAKPVATQGKSILDIKPYDVPVSPDYIAESGATPEVASNAVAISLETLKVFSSDYAKYQKQSESLNQEELMTLLPEAQASFRPLMNPNTLDEFSKKWTAQASNPEDLENTIFMLVTESKGETEKDNMWENSANLPCTVSDVEWTTTFSSPRLEYVAVEGADYKVTAFKATAHYLVPCAEGKVISQNMEWILFLGASADNSKWEVYRWERNPLDEPVYVG